MRRYEELQKDGYQHRSHNKNLLYVHLIFATKYRKKLLYGDIDQDIKRSIYEISVKHHWYIKKMETDKDHIHILLQYGPTDSIMNIVTILKSYSTYYIWKRHSDTLSREYWQKKVFWSNGYFAASIGNISKAVIEKYIAEQG